MTRGPRGCQGFADVSSTLLWVSKLRQLGVAGRPGTGSWRLPVPRLRRKLPDTVRGQAKVLELSYADYLGNLRGERHGCPPWASGSRSPRRRWRSARAARMGVTRSVSHGRATYWLRRHAEGNHALVSHGLDGQDAAMAAGGRPARARRPRGAITTVPVQA